MLSISLVAGLSTPVSTDIWHSACDLQCLLWWFLVSAAYSGLIVTLLYTDHWSESVLTLITLYSPSDTLMVISAFPGHKRVWFIVELIHPFIARHDHLEVNKVRIYNPSQLRGSTLGRENISHDHLSQPEVCQWFNIASGVNLKKPLVRRSQSFLSVGQYVIIAPHPVNSESGHNINNPPAITNRHN